jgi:hypothetical protein
LVAFSLHPAFIGAAYNSIQAMNLLPAYNQHLAGMQQLAQICVGNGQAQQHTRFVNNIKTIIY